MLAELNQAKRFLVNKFGDVNSVLPGTYAVPTETSKGPAYMKVTIAEDLGMSDFSLWMDEAFTEDWYSLAEPIVQLETISVKGIFVYEIPSKNHWVNRFPGALPNLPEVEQLLWIDKNGNIISCGEDFMRAEDFDSYPVRVYHLHRTAHDDPKNAEYLKKIRAAF